MSEPPKLELIPVDELQYIKGVAFPAHLKFRQLLVTGPPGSGKTQLINKVGGWPEEGYIDLTLKNWWRAQSLTFRPREVHLGFPFVGYDEALTVFDKEWLEAPQPLELDLPRIVLPPAKSSFMAVKWRRRFVFEFLIPPSQSIFKWRLERSRRTVHPVDRGVTLEQVERQAAVYREAALYFHRSGMLIYIRDEYDGVPKVFVDTGRAEPRSVEVGHWGSQCSMLEKLRSYFRNGDERAVLALGPEPLRVDRPVRVAFDGSPLELVLGKHKLHLRPETGVTSEAGAGGKDWILLDPARFYTEVVGFERLASGAKLLVGRANERLDKIFNFPKSVMKRHLIVANENGQVLLRPLDRETETYVSRVEDGGETDPLRSLNLKNLRQLREIFGGPIELLSPEEALVTIEQAIEILKDEACRAKDSRGRPGGVLELPAQPTPVIVGDLHAEVDNLLKILSVGPCLEGLESGKAVLLLLGDTVHSQDRDGLEEMDSSLLMLDLILKLKIRFPTRVFCLRGNHETLDESVGKAGVPQGLILHDKAQALRGPRYVERLAEYFELLAYVAKTDDFIATHAGPTRSGATLQDLIDIRDHPQLAWQLIWNRVQSPTRPAGYTKKHVKIFRERLGVDKGTPLIVSHTPLALDGTVWMNVGEIKNHHVVYSANPDSLAVFIRVGREMVPLEYPAEPILEFANQLDLARQ